MINDVVHETSQRLRKVLLENELLKSKVLLLQSNNSVLESRIAELMREKAGNVESIALLKERILTLEDEKKELEQALSEIYDG